MNASALRVAALSKAFPARRSLAETLRHPRSGVMLTALDRLSFTVEEGEFFGFLGENGAGKTTLFRILSTLVLPDAGTVEVLGTDVTRDPAQVRRLLTPVLVSERSLSWRLSASENLRLYAAFYRIGRREMEPRIAELLRVVGLEQVGDRMVGTFSSGMKQRLMLARALLARPRFLLLDEPTRSLDPLAARAFRQFLKDDIGRGQGCTVLLATHDPDEVRDLCDRIGVLHRGRLLGIGTPDSLARELGVHRFRLVTTEPEHPAILRLPAEGIRLGPVTDVTEGWRAREVELPAGEALAARVLADLLAAGVSISRFERVELPLADLLERIVRERTGPAHA